MNSFLRAFLSGLFVAALASSGHALSLVADGDFSDDPGIPPWYATSVNASAHSSDGSPEVPNARVAGGSELGQVGSHQISASESYTVSYLAAWISGGTGANTEVGLTYLYESPYGDMPVTITEATESLSLTNHDWQSHQFVFTPTAGEYYIGKKLGIRLACSSSSSVAAGFDTVSIEVSQIPEPSTVVILATGLLSLLAFARRKRG
jgi:hypothetical protein